MTRAALFYSSLFLLFSGTALAQQAGRNGIAYVQAPEMAIGVCTGKSASEAFDCARKQCIETGGTKEDCQELAYCFPARWSIDVFMMAEGGPHWHEFYCGWETREQALKAAAVACDKSERPGLSECMGVTLYDEEGNAEKAFED